MNNLRVLGINLAQYREDTGVYPAAPLPEYLQTLDPSFLPFSDLPFDAPELYAKAFHGKGANKEIVLHSTPGHDGYTAPESHPFMLQIDTAGPPATFRCSYDNGLTWVKEGVVITSGIPLSIGQGLTATFDSDNGHATGDTWTFTPRRVQPEWPEGVVPQPLRFSAEAASGDSTIHVNPTVQGRAIKLSNVVKPRMPVLLCDRGVDPPVVEVATVANVNATALTIEFTKSLTYAYSTASILDFRTQNYGLATTYYQRDRVKETRRDTADTESRHSAAMQAYHCPAMHSTEDVDIDANLAAVNQSGMMQRRFDPLWSGYNTYDLTYNYDQFDDDIYTFDKRRGFSSADPLNPKATLNHSRQLNQVNPPTDTVVCWCYGHQPDQSPSVLVLDSIIPDVLGDTNPARDRERVRAAEKAMARYQSLVLWVDGSVGVMRPTLIRGKYAYGGGMPAYYWVPPFLFSPGDWRQ